LELSRPIEAKPTDWQLKLSRPIGVEPTGGSQAGQLKPSRREEAKPTGGSQADGRKSSRPIEAEPTGGSQADRLELRRRRDATQTGETKVYYSEKIFELKLANSIFSVAPSLHRLSPSESALPVGLTLPSESALPVGVPLIGGRAERGEMGLTKKNPKIIFL